MARSDLKGGPSMPRVRLELDQPTFDALVEAAVRERRPIPWHAEVIIRRVLGTQPDEADSSTTTPNRPGVAR